MIDENIEHHIQKYIMMILYRQKNARFSDLRKQDVDTNLFAYHLKLLTKRGMVKKTDEGYTLGEKGLAYVDRVSERSMTKRMQPKIVTMLLIQNDEGEILLWKRNKQPYIDTWTLPYGKLHIEDTSIRAAVAREAKEKLSITLTNPEHAGECYIHVFGEGGAVMSSTLAHIFRYNTNNIPSNENLIWVRPHKLARYILAPAVEEIITRTFFHDPYFFEEYSIKW